MYFSVYNAKVFLYFWPQSPGCAVYTSTFVHKETGSCLTSTLENQGFQPRVRTNHGKIRFTHKKLVEKNGEEKKFIRSVQG